MSARVVTAGQLRAYVDKARRDGRSVVGFRAAPQWNDEQSLGDDVLVAPCASTLAVRSAVWDHLARADGRLLVILTDRDDIGQEVTARFYRGQLLRPESFEILKGLFRVTEIAQPLTSHQWLADLLVQVAPPGRSFAPPPGGILTLDAAWQALLTHGLQLPTERPTLRDLLVWATAPTAQSIIATLADTDVAHIRDRLVSEIGPSAGPVITLLGTGNGSEAIPLGLVAGTLWSTIVHGEDAGRSRGRFEALLDGESVPATAARTWGAAAEGIVRAVSSDPDQTAFTTWTGRATTILRDVDGEKFLAASAVLPAAFDARLAAAGRALTVALERRSADLLGEVDRAVDAVRAHVDADRQRHRLRTVEMAQRLTRRHVTNAPNQEPKPVDLAQAAHAYITDAAWVDEARLTLLGGDPVDELASATARLVVTTTEQRRVEDLSFAAKLAPWLAVSPTGNDGVIPIEHVLERVVAPAVASGVPALVLLIDGLSWAQAHRMFADIAQRRFRRVALGGSWMPVVSTLPSVTRVSRSSLFCGAPAAGGQDVEREGFAHQRVLLEAAKGPQPVLFHKADLSAQDGNPAPGVREAITDPTQRVVGVVVNGADDHLDKGGQLELADGLRALKPLDPLLNWAVEAERAVVVVADHGHIREAGSVVRPAKGGGERWRPADSAIQDDEVLLEGPRVLAGEGRIIAPATEGVRFNPTKKLGYHGGATPQEVLCPLAVFVPGTVEIDGWLPELPQQPAWWEEAPVAQPAVVAAVRPVPEPTRDQMGVPTLFGSDNEVTTSSDDEGAVTAPDWVQALVDTELFDQQQSGAGRQTLGRDDVVALLTLLSAAGGTLAAEAFATAVGSSPLRARSKAVALATLLNVDGYAAVTVDGSGEVRLDTGVLFAQFGLT